MPPICCLQADLLPPEAPQVLYSHQLHEDRDIQGIQWNELGISRRSYRARRMLHYVPHTNLVKPKLQSGLATASPNYENEFFEFVRQTTKVLPSFVHFQLRHMLCAPTKHDVYTLDDSSINLYNPVSQKTATVLDLSSEGLDQASELNENGHICPCCIAVEGDLLMVGGYKGEFLVKNMATMTVLDNKNSSLTDADNCITNSISVYDSHGHGKRVLAANNDCFVKSLDLQTLQAVNEYKVEWAVNHSSGSPDGKVVCLVGDSTEVLIADANSREIVHTLRGHLDYSFSSSFHPLSPHYLATANQDGTARVWDLRSTKTSVEVLSGRLAAMRAAKYSPNGDYLFCAEEADYVHIYDMTTSPSSASSSSASSLSSLSSSSSSSSSSVIGSADHLQSKQQRQGQLIDIFGEIAGFDVTPDGQSLFIGVSDRLYGCLLEFELKSSTEDVYWL